MRSQRHRGRRRHTLSMHLLTLFLVAGFLLILIIAGIFRGAWRYQFEDAVAPHIEQYVDYIRADLGDPPDTTVAARLAARLPVEIAVTGPEVRWSSVPEFPDPGQVHIFHGHAATLKSVNTAATATSRASLSEVMR